MKTFKSIFFILAVIINIQCFASICVISNKMPEFSAGIMLHGHELAFADNNFSDYKNFSVNNDIDFVNQLQQMTQKSCPIVLGFIISHECFISSPILKKNQIIGLSTTCSHDDIERFFPFLYSAHPPVSKQIDKIVERLNKTSSPGGIFVVHQPTELYSEAQFKQFQQKFTGKFIDVPIDTDAQFDIKKILANNKDASIIFFTYPLPSTKIIIELSNHGLLTKKTRIFGNASWAESFEILLSLKRLLKEVKEVEVINVLDWNKIQNTSFVKKFKSKFGREPLDAEVLNYDITTFAIKCYNRAFNGNEFKKGKFQYCLTHTKYIGISGSFSFSKDSVFANRPLYLTNLLDRT